MRGGLTKGQGKGVRPQDQRAARRREAHGPCLFSGEMLLMLPSSARPCSRWARICSQREQSPAGGPGPGPPHLPPGPFPHTPSRSLPSTQVAATCSAEGSEVKGRDDLEPPPLHQHTVVSFLQWVCRLR